MADNKDLNKISAQAAAELKENEKTNSRLPKMLIGISVAVIVIVAIVLCYIYFVRKPGQEKAATAAADVYIEALDKQSADSIVAAAAAKAAEAGYDEGNNMRLVAAISYYNDGKYEQAIEQLNDFDPKEAIIGAAAMSLKGDAYVNTDQLDQAVKAFTEAIKISDNNPQYTPVFMLKLARVYRAQNNAEQEQATLNQIRELYPVFADQNGVDAYIARLD